MPLIAGFTTSPGMPLIPVFPGADTLLILAVRVCATVRVCDPQHSPQTRTVALADRRRASSRCSWHRRRVEEVRLATGPERAAKLLLWTLAESCLLCLCSFRDDSWPTWLFGSSPSHFSRTAIERAPRGRYSGGPVTSQGCTIRSCGVRYSLSTPSRVRAQ